MIVLLSPSKTINPKSVNGVVGTSLQFIDEAGQLVDSVNKLGKDLGKVLGVSDKLTEENRQRFKNWSTGDEQAMAAWAYRGETFFGLSIEQMDEASLAYAQDHLRIVSGLYGLLRPQDVIMPYRLEMSTKLSGKWGKNLYEFWGSILSDEVAQLNPTYVLNCASVEYSKAVIKHLPKDLRVITVKFLSQSPTGLKSKMVFAKYSRGLMARWAIENRVENPEDLKRFNVEGYIYDEDLSTENEYVYVAPAGFSIKGRFTKL